MTWSGASTGEHFLASNPPVVAALSGTPWVNVKDPLYGAKGDGQEISNAVMNGTNAILTCASNPFVVADVGKQITVYGAGAAGGQLSTTILSFQSAGAITLAANSQTNAPSNFASWGTDDTAAIQAAINAIPLQTLVGGGVYGVSGGVVFFPPGVYFTTATLTQTMGTGLIMRGSGSRATVIAPTLALAGLPVINFIDHRGNQVEFMNVRGTPAGTVASAAIQSTRHTANTTGNTGAQLQVRSCLLGSDVDIGIAVGVKWTADSTALDQNNDFGTMLDVTVENFSVAAYSIGHANSLLHRIIGGFVLNGPSIVQLFGGSFFMEGTGIGGITGAAFDFEAPVGAGSPAYYHKSSISCLAETTGTIVKAVAGATGPLDVDLIGTGWKGSNVPLATTIAAGSNGAVLPQASISVAANALPASGSVVIVTTTGNRLVTYTGGGGTATLTGCSGGTGTLATGNAVTQAILQFDFQAPSGRLSLIGCDLLTGQPGIVAQFTHASSSVELIGNTRLGLQTILYNGALRSYANTHDPGSVTYINLGSGTLMQSGDNGGGFTPTMTTFEDATLQRVGTGQLSLGQALVMQGATASGQLIIDTGPTANAQLVWRDNNTTKWQQYLLHGDPSVYLRDLVNNRMQVTYTPGASIAAALTDINSALTSEGPLTANAVVIAAKDIRRSRQTPTEAVLVSGVDATAGENIEVTLTAARVVGAPLNPAIGQHLVFSLIQGGAGAFAVTWNAVFKKTWADTGNATGARSSIEFVYNGTNWNQVSAQSPYV